MAAWYYVENEARIGPVEASEMERLVSTGRIRPDTLVWQDGMGDWAAARDHFNTAAVPPGVPPASPAMGAAAGMAQAAPATGGLYAGAPARSLGEAIGTCFSKYATFSGRASRSEFWYWVLFTVIAGIGFAVLDGVFFGFRETDPQILGTLFSLATFLPGLAVAFRRLHDTGRSGWWVGAFAIAFFLGAFAVGFAIGANPYSDGPFIFAGVLTIAAVAYGIVLLVFYCQKGDLGRNQYG